MNLHPGEGVETHATEGDKHHRHTAEYNNGDGDSDDGDGGGDGDCYSNRNHGDDDFY